MSNINFKKIGEFIDENLFPICQQLSPTILTIFGLWLVFWYPDAIKEFEENGAEWYWWFKQWTIILVFFSAVISIITSFMAASRSKRKDKEIFELKNRGEILSININNEINERRRISKLLEDAEYTIDANIISQQQFVSYISSKYLMHMFVDHLRYSDNERISLYRHEGGEFFIAGRYSQNIDFNEVSRIRFPDDEGCLGEAWKTGNITSKRFSTRRKRDYEEWQEHDCRIPLLVAKKIRMKSVAYMAIPINESSSRVGVLLLESLVSDNLGEQDVVASLEEHKTYLVEMLKESKRVGLLGRENNMEVKNG